MNYLYQIINLLNNKIYVGVHKTNNIDDGYMGSGKIIKSAVEKYGIENFKKEILEFFDTYEEALAKEAEIVTDEFLLREDVYNLRRGGSGGFDYINKEKKNIDIEEQRRRDPTLKNRAIESMKAPSAEWCKNNPEKKKENSKLGGKAVQAKYGSHFTIINNSEEFQIIKKKKFAEIGHQQGDKNSQFDTSWITDGITNKKIQKDLPIPSGWSKGRKIKI